MKIYVQRVSQYLEPLEEINMDGFLCIRFESDDQSHIDIDFSDDTENGISIVGDARLLIHPRAANHLWIEVIK
jgi:hypothetical protein